MLPSELKARPQWCFGLADGKGTFKAPGNPHNGKRASVTDPSTWGTYEQAVAASGGNGVGYVLKSDDPYAVIDLDVKNVNNYPNNPEDWTSQIDLDRFWAIVQAFDSYTERSTSGQGLHVWVKGSIGTGCKRDGVEVYSQERFIICTGDSLWDDKPINADQMMLDQLIDEIRKGQRTEIELIEEEPIFTHAEIYNKLATASNADKFKMLFNGDWQLDYPSQSEADLALMSMFTFHSPSNKQCREMFRGSGLGKRAKAVKNDRYLNYTLKIIRARQHEEKIIEEEGERMAAALLASQQPEPNFAPVPAPHPDTTPPIINVDKLIENAINGNRQKDPEPQQNPEKEKPWLPEPEDRHYEPARIDGDEVLTGLQWPPGMAGEIAKWMYANAPRPVREISIVSTLGLLAGICGKAYQIPQSGLNLYIVLVARSGVGKEAMHSGISKLNYKMMENNCNTITQYTNFKDFASGPALAKEINTVPSFCNIAGEWGRKLKRLSMDERGDGPMQQLRTIMTNLYQKSGHESIVGGISYSDKEKTVESVGAVAYSMIGETTPGTFYESLTQSMQEDGFLSRFTIVEYNGDRPPLNIAEPVPLGDHIINSIAGLVGQVDTHLANRTVCYVHREPLAGKMLDDYNLQCDANINAAGDDESTRQMWNRAHLKVCRVAALLACVDNNLRPTIRVEHVEWALDLISRDIAVMERRMNMGDIGTGDDSRELKVLSFLSNYVKQPPAAGYNIPESLRLAGIVPYSYIKRRAARLSGFTSHRDGSTRAIDSAIKGLIDSGYLQEVDKMKLVQQFNFHGKCYRILTLPRAIAKEGALKNGKG